MIESLYMHNNFKVKNIRFFISFLAVHILISCAPSVVPVNALQTEQSDRPEWVSRKPASSFYYVGVGYSQKDRSDNYVQSSKQNALDDMISEISVSISSVSVLNQLDDGKGLSEQYESIIKTAASDDIEGYELVDSWENEDQYWVYYRLSKSKYKQRKEEMRENAMTLAKDNYVGGKQRIAEGDITSGLRLYVNGLYVMAPYLAQSNNVLVNGDSVLLGNALYNEIQKTFNEMTISSEKEQYTINRILDSDVSIDVAVKTKGKNQPIGELPLKAKFLVGEGNVQQEYTTNARGTTDILLSSIRSKEPKQVISVTPDIDKLITSQEGRKKYGMLLQGLQLPQKELHFQIKKPIVYIESSEKRLGQPTQGTSINEKVKQIFSTEGFVLGRIKDKADLWVELIADTDKGKASGSIYVTYFNLNINVIDMATGAEIHHAGIDRLKAYSLNYDRSSQSGYDKALEILEKETMPKLIEEILR